MKKILIFIILSTLFTGCGTNEESVDIVVSSFATNFIVTEIVGEELTVQNIIPENADPHEYEPTQKEIKLATDAKMVFYIDDHFDESLSQIEGSIPILDNLSTNYDNPHFWISPKKMVEATEFIYQELEEEYGNKFEQNYQSLKEKLLDLDLEYQEKLNEVKFNTFIVSHNSFAHLKDYNIESIPLSNSDHENNDTSQKDILDIIEYIEENDITYIAVEKNIACSTCEVIEKEVSIKTLEVDSFEFTDENTDYFSIQRNNLGSLVKIMNL
ncbi:MAG: metal ABC transporter substrate-binding protein [Bacilli bacterium]